MFFNEIYDIEFDTFALAVFEGEKEPLDVSFRICVILKDQVILLYFTLLTSISQKEVSTLKR